MQKEKDCNYLETKHQFQLKITLCKKMHYEKIIYKSSSMLSLVSFKRVGMKLE